MFQQIRPHAHSNVTMLAVEFLFFLMSKKPPVTTNSAVNQKQRLTSTDGPRKCAYAWTFYGKCGTQMRIFPHAYHNAS